MTGSLIITRSPGQSFFLDSLRITVRAVAAHRVKLAVDSTPPVEAWCGHFDAVQIGESYVTVDRAGGNGAKVRLAICAPKAVKVMREELLAGIGGGR